MNQLILINDRVDIYDLKRIAQNEIGILYPYTTSGLVSAYYHLDLLLAPPYSTGLGVGSVTELFKFVLTHKLGHDAHAVAIPLDSTAGDVLKEYKCWTANTFEPVTSYQLEAIRDVLEKGLTISVPV